MSEGGRVPTPEDLERATRGRRRREPRYAAFLGAGAVLGVAAAAVLSLLVDAPAQYSRAALFGYLAVALVLLGALLGGLVAVLSSLRRR